MQTNNHIRALDGLRTLAVGLVVLCHLSYHIAPGGNIGVDIFFVLSGFLITRVLLREYDLCGSVSLGRFYVRRALRLYPALILLVLCALAFGAAFGGPNGPDGWSALAAITYTMDFVRGFSGVAELSPLGHTWSLAVEEQFYLIWPMALLLILNARPRVRPLIAGLCVLLAVLWREWLATRGAPVDRIYYCFDTRAWQPLIGCALALWLHGDFNRRAAAAIGRLWPLALAGILALAHYGTRPLHQPAGVSYLLGGFLAAILILEISQRPAGRLARALSRRLPVWLGTISYGIYLWHYPLLVEAGYWTHDSKAARLAAVILAVLVAAVSYHFVERSFLRLKQHYEPRPGRPAPGGSPARFGDPA